MNLMVQQLIWILANYITQGFAITNGRIVFDPATSSSVALVQAFRRGRTARSYGYRPTNECTGSLICSQVVITAGHCVKSWKGHSLMVKFLNRKKLLLYRKVKTSRVFHQGSDVDMAILLLDRPIMVCNSDSDHLFEILKLPFKGVYDWNDKIIESSQCTIFGFGKNEKNRHLDYQLRSMPVRLKAESPNLSTTLMTNQKICEGDSGGPVLCKRNGHNYLIAISTRVTAQRLSHYPQLCFLRIPSGEYAVVNGAKFYDIRHGLPQITRFLKQHNLIEQIKADYERCF